MSADVVVLCYHGISDTWPDATAVTPADFGAQIEDWVRRGYRGQGFTDALTAPVAERVFAVTFDDAPLSVFRHAAPVLAELGVPATVFVATSYTTEQRLAAWDGISRWLGSEHEEELRCMTWDQLGELADAGWEVGSHTRTHPRLSTLDAAAIAEELAGSRRECEESLGRPCLSLAYPYGEAVPLAAEQARAAGYVAAATVPTSPTPPLPLLWPRVGVYRGDSARRVWIRSTGRRLGLVPGAGAAIAGAGRAARALRRGDST